MVWPGRPPRCSSTTISDGPKPAFSSRRATAAGVWLFSDSTSSLRPGARCRCRASGDGRARSGTGSPEAPSPGGGGQEKAPAWGRTSISPASNQRARVAPTPKCMGSPEARTTTLRPRNESSSARPSAKGVGHGRLSAPSTRARWRSPPTSTSALSITAPAAGDRPASPSSPIPTIVSQVSCQSPARALTAAAAMPSCRGGRAGRQRQAPIDSASCFGA